MFHKGTFWAHLLCRCECTERLIVVFGTMKASDADGDSIEYRRARGNLDEKFDIDPTTG